MLVESVRFSHYLVVNSPVFEMYYYVKDCCCLLTNGE
jgi:hypothetical protein